MIYDEKEILSVNYFPYEVKIPHIFKIISDEKIEYSKKYLNRDFLDSLVNDCDEVVIVQNGLITDSSKANIAIFQDGKWLVAKKPLLFGTTMQRLVEDGFLTCEDISVDIFKGAKKIALMNAMIGFLEVEEFVLLP